MAAYDAVVDTSAVLLDTFAPAVAVGVVAVLRDEGIAVTTAPTGDGESRILVLAADRDRALQVLAQRMDEVAHLAAGARMTHSGDTDELDDDDRGPPMVLERFRSYGILVVLLIVPVLLMGSLFPRIPALGVIAVLVGIVLVVATLQRRRPDDE